EFEVRYVDRRSPLHAALDQRDRLGGARAGHTGRGAALGGVAADRVDTEVTELAIEEAMIGAAAEFAIRGEPKADTLLERENVLNGIVFRRGQLLALVSPHAKRARISSSLGGRRKLPMCSARNGGLRIAAPAVSPALR